MEYFLEVFADIHWGAVLQIIIIDILLGGDNAVVIAMACRNLDPHMRSRRCHSPASYFGSFRRLDYEGAVPEILRGYFASLDWYQAPYSSR